MAGAESYRRIVVARAGGACEYCRLLQDASGVTFHIEHVIPISSGGLTTFANLALSCPGCNLSKSDHRQGIDLSGVERPLFNPRSYDPWLLGWHLHFHLDHATGRIRPLTPVGAATINTLNINSERRVFARHLQIIAGLIR